MLNISQLTFKKEKRYLIKNLTYTFLPGKIYGILGPNGSGKTTLLKTLSGIWEATEGTVFWNGENLIKKSRKEISRILTFVSQSQPIPFDFPVKDIVAMGRYPLQWERNDTEAAVKGALEMVDAVHLYNRLVTELSHGERQRIFLAKALITKTPILLLDEPATNLDIRHQIDLWALLKSLANDGKTILISNHDLFSTIKHCDFVYIMNQGECAAQGIPTTVLTPEVLKKVFNVDQQLASLFINLTLE